MDGLAISWAGVGIGAVTLISGTAGVLLRQARNNGRLHQKLDGFEKRSDENLASFKKDVGGKLDGMGSDLKLMSFELGKCKSSIAEVTGYLKGRKNGIAEE